MRHRLQHPLIGRPPPVQPSHVGFNPGFVEEDETVGVDAGRLERLEFGPPFGDIGPGLFSGNQRFFERDVQRPQRLREQGEGAVHPQTLPQFLPREVRLLGNGRPDFGPHADMKSDPTIPRGTRFNLAGGFVLADEPADPLRRNVVPECQRGKVRPGLIICQHPSPDIHRERFHVWLLPKRGNQYDFNQMKAQ